MKFSTLAVCGALLLGPLAHAGLQARLFELQIDPAQQSRFNRTGRHNLGTSIEREAGTLVMLSARSPEQAGLNYVFEVYRDAEAYRTHTQAAHFQAFAAMAKETVTSRKAAELKPEFLAEQGAPLRVFRTEGGLRFNYAEISVKPKHNAAFRRLVRDEMRQTMAKEKGVLAMYALTLKTQPHEWRFLEIYADEAAYQNHRKQAYFQHYLTRSKDWMAAKKVLRLIPDTLVNQGTINQYKEAGL